MSTNVLESMVVKLIGDGTSYFNMLTKAQSQTTKVTGLVGRQITEMNRYGSQLSGIGRSIASWGMGLTSLVGIGSAIGALNLGAKLASDFEQAEIQFGVMLHDTDKAAKMMADIEKFAAETPLNTAGITQAAKTLLQFNVAGNNIMPMLKALGDATGGNNERFQHMSLAFGQMSSAGRLMGQDLLQFINAGFNPLQEIAKTTGKSMAQLKHDMENGAISTNMVMKAFQTATAAGGQFDGLLQKQSQSLGGLFSTLSDNVQIQLKRLTKFVFDAIDLKGLMKRMSDFVQNSQKPLEAWAMYFIKQAKSIYNYVAPSFIKIGKVVYSVVSTVIGYWNSLSSSFRTTLPIIALIVTAFGPVLAAVIAVVGWIPIMSAFLAIAISQVIEYFGGIEQVWSNVLSTFNSVMEYMTPIVSQFADTAIALWNAVGEGFIWVFNQLNEVANSIFGDMSSGSQGFAKAFQEYVIASLVLAEFMFKNAGDIFARMILACTLDIVAFGSDMYHLFGVQIPGYISNLSRNWVKFFTEMASATANVFENIAQNISDVMTEIWDFIASGGTQGLNFAWAPLKAGFILTLEEMVDIGPRKISELEKEMSKSIAALDTKLSEDFAAFLAKKNNPIDKLLGDPKTLEKAALAAAEETKKTGLTMGDNIANGVKHGVHQLDAVLRGSAKAFDAFWEYYSGKRQGTQQMGKVKGNFNSQTVSGKSPLLDENGRFDYKNHPGNFGRGNSLGEKAVDNPSLKTNGSGPGGYQTPKERRAAPGYGPVDIGGNSNSTVFNAISESLKTLVQQGLSDGEKLEIEVVNLV